MAFYSDEVLMLVLCSNSNTCYNKCVKRFFGYNKYDSATAAFMELKLPTANTVWQNHRALIKARWKFHSNSVLSLIRGMHRLTPWSWCLCSCVLVFMYFYRTSICEGGLGSRDSVRPSVCLCPKMFPAANGQSSQATYCHVHSVLYGRRGEGVSV